jgi:hypothetical protein
MLIVYNSARYTGCSVSGKSDMRKLVYSAVKRGWRNVTGERKRGGNAHYVLEWTDGTRIRTATTPSCSHAVKNAAADLARVEKGIDIYK